MSGVAVGSGVEVHGRTAEAAGLGEDPFEEPVGVAPAAVGLEGDEIVDVENVAPGQRVEAPKAGGRYRFRPVERRSR